MNYLSALGAKPLPSALAGKRRWALFLGLIVIAACGLETSESADRPDEREYYAHYSVQVDPDESSVDVTLEIKQSSRLLREVSFRIAGKTIGEFSGDGKLSLADDTMTWLPPAAGGKLTWRAQVAHKRGQNGYDAWINPDWGIFRAEDIIPRAKSRSLKGAKSNTTLSFQLPPGWSAITEYSATRDPIVIDRKDRRFDQPTGWMVLGDIGVRRETIAGVRVAVAGPQGHAVRRMDMLALLHWTLPELTGLLAAPLDRLTIVSAGDPMWRGGLSAPASLYIHADRPLISENATSTLLHELMHVALSIRAEQGVDWIVEGLAEFYSLELLRRGSAISARRYSTAISDQADWATTAETLCGETSSGATTALAVIIFHKLDKEIRAKTRANNSGSVTLDDLLTRLIASNDRVDLSLLSEIAAELIGEPSDALHIDKLPGCHKMTAGTENN